MTPADVHALAVAAGLGHEAAVVATAVAWGESGLRSGAVGDEDLADDLWGPSIGLWQIRSLRSQRGTGAGRDADRLADPEFNAVSMSAISRRGTDWSPWTVWRTLAYRSHLEAVRAALGQRTMNGWMPDVLRTPPRGRGGLKWLDGTAWKLLLHTTESNYRRNGGGRDNYHGHQGYPHFEISEEAIEQYLPITVGAYALAPATTAYGYGNHAHAVQVEIVWNAADAQNMSEPLLRNIAAVLTWLRRETGMAPNLPPQGFPRRISTDNWFSVQGWYDHEGLAGHGNVPGNFDRWDPGPLPARRIVALSDAQLHNPDPQEPEVAKIVQQFSVRSGEARRIPVVAIGGGFGWTRVSVTFASLGVDVVQATIGPNERPVPNLSPGPGESGRGFGGRGWVDLVAGDEWLAIELATSPHGTLDLTVEAADG